MRRAVTRWRVVTAQTKSTTIAPAPIGARARAARKIKKVGGKLSFPDDTQKLQHSTARHPLFSLDLGSLCGNVGRYVRSPFMADPGRRQFAKPFSLWMNYQNGKNTHRIALGNRNPRVTPTTESTTAQIPNSPKDTGRAPKNAPKTTPKRMHAIAPRDAPLTLSPSVSGAAHQA
jgi:hypothetical protein